MFEKGFWAKAAMGLAVAWSSAAPIVAWAQEEGGTKTAHELRADYNKAVQSKTIAFLPIALGVPLQDEWERVIRTEAAWRGMKYVVRDPNNNPSAMQQALTALVNDKPDVLIVQNPSVTLLMKELKRAESQGTHVIQVNMSSNYKSDAFVGADWDEVGRLLAEDVVKQCGTGSGKSGKVSDRAGRTHGRRQRRSDRRHHGHVQEGPGDQGGIQPGCKLGRQRRPEHHFDRDPAEPRPLRQHRLLGNHANPARPRQSAMPARSTKSKSMPRAKVRSSIATSSPRGTSTNS